MIQGANKQSVAIVVDILQTKLRQAERVLAAGCIDCEHSDKTKMCRLDGGSFEVPHDVWVKGCDKWSYDEVPFSREVSENLS